MGSAHTGTGGCPGNPTDPSSLYIICLSLSWESPLEVASQRGTGCAVHRRVPFFQVKMRACSQ